MVTNEADEYSDDQDVGFTRQRVRDQHQFLANEVDLSDNDSSARGTSLYHRAQSHKSSELVRLAAMHMVCTIHGTVQCTPLPGLACKLAARAARVAAGCDALPAEGYGALQGTTHNWSEGEDEGGSPGSSGQGSSYFSGEQLHSRDSPVAAQVGPAGLRPS